MHLDFIKSTRPLNLIAILIAQVGVYSRDYSDKYQILITLWSTLFLVSAGNIHNDLADRLLDRECKGKKNSFIDSSFAITIVYLSYTLSLVFALILYRQSKVQEILYVSIFSILLMILYNVYLKKIALIGNLLISLLCVLSIWVPILVIGANLMDYIEILILLFSYTFIREWVKDIEDKDCDMQYGYKTIAVLMPEKYSGIILSVMLIGLTIFVYLSSLYLYLFICLLSAMLCIFLLKNMWNKASLTLKIILFAGIIELYLR